MQVDIEKIRANVIEMIDMTREPSNDELREIIDETINQQLDKKKVSINERYKIHKTIYDSIRGLGIIEELLDDTTITEIMINGSEKIFIERDGAVKQIESSYKSEARLNDVIQQIVGRTNKRVNESNPIVDTRLEDGSRVNVVLPPIALNGPVVTIRKFPEESIDIEKLIKWKSITREAAEFLRRLVCAGYNIFVSGGTGSGKTTFLNALSNFIQSDERVITIEDSAELQLKSIKNLVSMEARDATNEGTKAITIRDLIKTSLRMRPDRIIVGEVRGPEALDMLQAMNTGHDGSMSTGHANSPHDMLMRLETMVLTGIEMPLVAIRSQIASGIDLVVHLGRLSDKSRKVIEIDEVMGIKEGEIVLKKLYNLDMRQGVSNAVLKPTKNKLEHTEKLVRHEGEVNDI